MAHTPGPWSVDDSYDALFLNENPGRKEQVIEIVNREAGGTPCYATNDDDARLITASPEMLAALKRILPYVMKASSLRKPGPEYEHYHASEDVRKAIAKAEGRS